MLLPGEMHWGTLEKFCSATLLRRSLDLRQSPKSAIRVIIDIDGNIAGTSASDPVRKFLVHFTQ